MHLTLHLLMAVFDDRKKKAETKYSIAADTLYQTRRKIFFEVFLSSYDNNTNCKPYPHFNNRK